MIHAVDEPVVPDSITNKYNELQNTLSEEQSNLEQLEADYRKYTKDTTSTRNLIMRWYSLIPSITVLMMRRTS